MSVGKLLGRLGPVALLVGAALGGLGGAAMGLISEFQAVSDPKFASWGSGGSWFGTAMVDAVTGAVVGFAAGLVSFLGAAAGLLLRESVPGRSRWPIGAAAGMGAGTSTAIPAFLVLRNGGADPAVLLTGLGLVLLSGTLAALLSGRAWTIGAKA